MGRLSLGTGVMECRKEAARMMVRHGAVLMRGGGRKAARGQKVVAS
jgi:hypothetical protein